MDPALRRAGRFDREISLSIPSEEARVNILKVLCYKMRLENQDAFDYLKIARMTPGFVGADLEALTKEAAAVAVSRVFKYMKEQQNNGLIIENDINDGDGGDNNDTLMGKFVPGSNDRCHGDSMKNVSITEDIEAMKLDKSNKEEEEENRMQSVWRKPLTRNELQDLSVTVEDFHKAIKKVQPSVQREGFATVPGISWEDVGGMEEIKNEISFSITQPISHPEYFQALNISLATGILLYGPPGCGKTLIAKAVANESGANFMSIKGPELLNKYVGESERAVRQLFSRARAAAPCVLFFDEMDAMAAKRGNGDNNSTERVVNQLLTELDGMDGRKGVYVIAATNRPDMIDAALLRPGRLDKLLYVPLPDLVNRLSIFKALLRKTPLHSDVDIHRLANHPNCESYSGADLQAVVREACVLALKNVLKRHDEKNDDASDIETSEFCVNMANFDDALSRVPPSVSAKDRKKYDALSKRLKSKINSNSQSNTNANDSTNCD